MEGLDVVYHAPPLELHALRDVTVTVRPGEIVGVIGESGCGKSTLASAALGLLPGNAEVRNGRVMLEGTDLVDLDDEGLRPDPRTAGRADPSGSAAEPQSHTDRRSPDGGRGAGPRRAPRAGTGASWSGA